MVIGRRLLIKHEGKIQESIVVEFSYDDLKLKLDDGTVILRKFWEVRKIEEKEDVE